ncbi:hypothetical protein [Kitasatospora sp. HPMI-4]|uniref:hypothetical protein n=1 Tax=Kitasatospora sp. HPMI-4 TaxID=3448443 RepID=UPI003F1A8DDB
MLQTTRHDDPDRAGRYGSEVLTAISHDDRQLLPGRSLADAGEFTHAVLHGLVTLRRLERDGQIHGAEDDGIALRHLLAVVETRLLPRLEGLRDALTRTHQDRHLGTYADLADAMGVARSTASTRAGALLARNPSEGEQWATGAPVPAPPLSLTAEEALTQVQPLLLALAAGTADREQALTAAALLRRLAAIAGARRGTLPSDTGDPWVDLMRRVERDGPQVCAAGDLRALVPGRDPQTWMPGYGLDSLPAQLPADDRALVLVYRGGAQAMSLPAAAKQGAAALSAAAETFLQLQRMSEQEKRLRTRD